jgi:threonine aldolase
VLCNPDAHVLNYEVGGVALLGILPRVAWAGSPSPVAAALAATIGPGDDYSPRRAAVVLENTQTTLDGACRLAEPQRHEARHERGSVRLACK